MRVFLFLTFIVLFYAAVRQGTFDCSSDKSMLEQHWDTKLEGCKAACGIVDECNMYFEDESGEKLDHTSCTDLCMRQPDAKWAKCTIKVKIEDGCSQKTALRSCSEILPSPPEKDQT